MKEANKKARNGTPLLCMVLEVYFHVVLFTNDRIDWNDSIFKYECLIEMYTHGKKENVS